MQIPAPDIPAPPDIPAHATLPFYDLTEATYSNGYSVERTCQLIRESLFGNGKVIYCKKSIKKRGFLIFFQRKVENLAVIGDLPSFFAWPCYSGNHPAKFN